MTTDMEQLKNTYCRYDMVCDNPKGGSVEIVRMPEFFTDKPRLETHEQHVHPFYEVIWFQEGEGKHFVDFHKYEVKPNMVFFISPGQVHSFDEGATAKGYVIKICNGLLSSDALSNDGALLKYNVFNAYDSVPYITIEPQVADVLTHIIASIEQELGHIGTIGHMEYMMSLVKMLIIQFERSYKANDVHLLTPNKTSHRTFLSFRLNLEHNYRTMHSVKEYAEMLNVTTKTLSNYVAECSSYTPLEIINNRIVLEAKRLLRYSDHMIKEVAFELGFNDPSYFIKFFKRQVGCSPAEYRTPE